VTTLASLLATTEVKDDGWWGYLVVLCAVILFCGSVYLLLYTNLGNNIALMLSVASVTGFVMLLSFSWMTQQFPNGPLGRAPAWEVDDMVAQEETDFSAASQSLARDMDPTADSNDEAGSQISPDLEAVLAQEDGPFQFTRSPRPYDDSLSVLTADDLCTLRAALEGIESITSVDVCADTAASLLAAEAAAEAAASEPVAEGEDPPAPPARSLAAVLADVDASELDGLRDALDAVDLDSLTVQAEALADLAEITTAIGESDTAAAAEAEEAGEVVEPVADQVNQRSAESVYRITTLSEGQRARIEAEAPGALDDIPAVDADGLQAVADQLTAATEALGALEGDAALADDVQADVDASFGAVTAVLPEHETEDVPITIDAGTDFIIENTWDTGGDRKFPVWFSKTLHVAAVHFCLTDQRALELTPFGSPPVRVCEPLAEEQTAFVHLDLGARRIKATYTFFGSAILFGVTITALYLYETAGQPRRRRFGRRPGPGKGGGGGGGGGPESPTPPSPDSEREKELVG
jgi:hypothetical protein